MNRAAAEVGRACSGVYVQTAALAVPVVAVALWRKVTQLERLQQSKANSLCMMNGFAAAPEQLWQGC